MMGEVWLNSVVVSEEHIAYIFKDEDYAKQETSTKQ
jgi:hypothetical protein